jgi:site-specific recombinase XerD
MGDISGYLEPEQIHAIIEALSNVSKRAERDKLFFELMWQSGGRVQEVTTLVPEHIGMSSVVLRNLKQVKRVKDNTGKTIRVHDETAIKEVEISEDLCNRLKEYCKEHKIDIGQWVFPSNRDKKKPLNRWYVWDILTKASESAMVFAFGKRNPRTGGRFKGAYPHLLRHSCAVHLLDKTDNMELVREHLGHSDISTTQIYAKVKSTKMKKSMKDIEW